MKTSDIYLILTDTNPSLVRIFFQSNNNLFERYNKLISKKGSSIQFKIENDKNFIFNYNHFDNLCLLYLNNIINEIELNFIVDVICSSIPLFEDEEISNRLENLTDPEINGKISRIEINNLMYHKITS